MAVTSRIDEWWADGERVTLAVRDVDRSIFVRRIGTGSRMTLLHGFPGSTHDWAMVAPTLAADHALPLCDFLGFGASDRPPDVEFRHHGGYPDQPAFRGIDEVGRFARRVRGGIPAPRARALRRRR